MTPSELSPPLTWIAGQMSCAHVRDMTAVTAIMKDCGGCESPWHLFSVVVSNEQCNFIGNPHFGSPFAQAGGLPLCAPNTCAYCSKDQEWCPSLMAFICSRDLLGKGTSSWELGALPASIHPHSQGIQTQPQRWAQSTLLTGPESRQTGQCCQQSELNHRTRECSGWKGSEGALRG